ncbi:MAG: PAS domain S-box protein [Candidatus Obscuribacterales bacterium]|nr:PAS domain S-box protein [Candidatus Obscuribacterales bacterium]
MRHGEDRQEIIQANHNLVLMASIAVASTEPGEPAHFIRRSLEILTRANNACLAQYWQVQGDTLICTDHYFAMAPLPDIRHASQERRFSKGVGLPGRVWSNALPHYINSIEDEPELSFRRKGQAISCGIKSVFAFPIKTGPHVQGVIEIFSFEPFKITNSANFFYEKLGVYLAGIFRQKEEDTNLLRERHLAKSIIQNLPEGFLAIDETSRIIEWNERCTQIFGFEKSEAIGNALVELIIPARYQEAHMKGFFQYLSTGNGIVFDKEIKAAATTRDGAEITIYMRIFPIEKTGQKRTGAFIRLANQPEQKPVLQLD